MMMGIDPYQSIHESPINIRNLIVLFLFGMTITFNFIYQFNVATTFKEFTDSTIITSTIIVNAAVFTSNVLETAKLFSFIEGLNDIIQKSKFTSKTI